MTRLLDDNQGEYSSEDNSVGNSSFVLLSGMTSGFSLLGVASNQGCAFSYTLPLQYFNE